MRMDLVKFKNIHKGPCLVIGNGPSLKLEDIEKFSCPTFGSNQIYRLPYTPDYYSIVDKEMLDACLPLPDDFKPVMFLRAEACVKGNNPIYPIVAGGFSKNIDNFVVMGGTVTYVLLQIAYYMGFETVYLLGVDHRYPKSGQYRPGSAFIAGKDDPDHFSPADGKPYFRNGKKYNAPELDRLVQYYQWAKEFYESEGRRIINMTPNSALDVFDKGVI